MRFYEKQALQATIERVKFMQEMNFKKCTSKVKGYYYYCTICNKQIDYYEHLKYDGKCELCYYC